MQKKIIISIIVFLLILFFVNKLFYSQSNSQQDQQLVQQIKPYNKENININKDYIIMEATAYDLSIQSCGKSYSSPSRGIARDGFNLNNKSHKQAWTVSSNRFPMGTKLQLIFPESHKKFNGIYTVHDTGNFKENVLDIYVGDFGERVNKNTMNFGRVNVKVFVIKRKQK